MFFQFHNFTFNTSNFFKDSAEDEDISVAKKIKESIEIRDSWLTFVPVFTSNAISKSQASYILLVIAVLEVRQTTDTVSVNWGLSVLNKQIQVTWIDLR